MEKDTTTDMRDKVQLAIQEETVRINPLMMIKEGENLKKGREVNPMVKESIEEIGVTVEIEKFLLWKQQVEEMKTPPEGSQSVRAFCRRFPDPGTFKADPVSKTSNMPSEVRS